MKEILCNKNFKSYSLITLIICLLINILINILNPVNVLALITISFISIILVYRYKMNFIFILFLYSCIIPGIGDLGVEIIQGIKVSITDIILVIYLIGVICNKEKNILKYFVTSSVGKMLLGISFLFIVYGLIGYLQYGAQAIRIARNIIYVYLTFIVVGVYILNNRILNYEIINYKRILFLSSVLVLIIIKFFNASRELGEFRIFRTNESLIASLIVFMIFYISLFKNSIKKSALMLIFLILLIISGIIQQERTMILAIFVGGILTFIYMILSKGMIKRTIKFMITLGVIITIVSIVIKVMYSNNNTFSNLIDNYIIHRLQIIFESNTFVMDTSLSIRASQIDIIFFIISQSITSLIFGKGLGAYYLYNTFVVDSFWLWIIFNLGILGIGVFLYLFIKVLKKIINIKNTNMKICLMGYYLTTNIMMIATPNVLWRIDDAVNMGLILAIIISVNFHENMKCRRNDENIFS
ncbi:MAG: hypothetical protein ACRC7N_15705 [Clostridium sp.]